MENKPQTVFEKIDKQDEKLDDIALKLDGMNVDDLYALAKRTWNYGDFETAKKYYTYIVIDNKKRFKNLTLQYTEITGR